MRRRRGSGEPCRDLLRSMLSEVWYEKCCSWDLWFARLKYISVWRREKIEVGWYCKTTKFSVYDEELATWWYENATWWIIGIMQFFVAKKIMWFFFFCGKIFLEFQLERFCFSNSFGKCHLVLSYSYAKKIVIEKKKQFQDYFLPLSLDDSPGEWPYTMIMMKEIRH